MTSLEQRLFDDLASAEAQGLRRRLRPIERLSARECRVDGRVCLDFSSNDYMGLSFRPELKEGAIAWAERFGCGSGASRLISGTSGACLELEAKIAAWKGFEATLLLGSGYAANVGLIQALASRDGVIFADKLNHASLNSGCLLSQADFKRYRHLDVAHLARLLSTEGLPASRLVVTDSVFSMDGDIAPLAEIRALANAHDVFLLVDDAHASGVLGEKGHGLATPDNCDIVMSTFSKAMGSYGACVACSSAVRDCLVGACGPFIYSTALPPAVLGAISAAVDFVQTAEADGMRASLAENAGLLRRELETLGFETGPSETMIIPVIVGETAACVELAGRLFGQGIFAPAVRPPTVPKGTARLRLSLNAAHSKTDVERLLDVLKSCR